PDTALSAFPTRTSSDLILIHQTVSFRTTYTCISTLCNGTSAYGCSWRFPRPDQWHTEPRGECTQYQALHSDRRAMRSESPYTMCSGGTYDLQYHGAQH